MKALSIRQPWAWLIVNGYKDVENRSWRTKYRGQVLIHASAAKPSKEDMRTAAAILFKLRGWSRHLPDRDSFYRGGIIGVATVTDCVVESESPWFFGPVGLQLADAQELPFRPMKGRLSFFETHQRPHKTFSLLVPESYRDATEGDLNDGR